ncbi:MAG: hypothetical protein MJ252_23330 [archaeon]|nr:hypothetical protein [archaeon]
MKEIKKWATDNRSFIQMHEDRILDILKTLDEQKSQMDLLNTKVTNIGKRQDEFNIAELFATSDGLGDETKITLAAINSLEKKLMKKVNFAEDRIAKVEQDSLKLKSESKNLKNAQDSFNNMTLPGIKDSLNSLKEGKEQLEGKTANLSKANENLVNSLSDQKEELNQLNQKLNEELLKFKDELGPKIEEMLNSKPEKEAVEEKPENKEEKEKELKDMQKKLTEMDKKIRLIPYEFGLDELKNQFDKLKEELKEKSTLEQQEEVLKVLAEYKKKIEFLKEQLDTLTEEDNNDHNELQMVKKKMDMMNNRILDLRQTENNASSNSNGNRMNFDANKFVDSRSFQIMQDQLNREFKDYNNNLEDLRTLVENIINTIKEKASKRDLKALEDDLMIKLEDLKNACVKQFADKADVNRNIRFLDQQLKHVIEVNIKNSEKQDNWILAKKPLGGHICASCDHYIGDLKENNTHVHWNKYPQKDNEKIYRIGDGFSKMLQLISFDSINNTALERQGLKTQVDENSKTTGQFSKEKKLPKISKKNNNPGKLFEEDNEEGNNALEANQPTM